MLRIFGPVYHVFVLSWLMELFFPFCIVLQLESASSVFIDTGHEEPDELNVIDVQEECNGASLSLPRWFNQLFSLLYLDLAVFQSPEALHRVVLVREKRAAARVRGLHLLSRLLRASTITMVQRTTLLAFTNSVSNGAHPTSVMATSRVLSAQHFLTNMAGCSPQRKLDIHVAFAKVYRSLTDIVAEPSTDIGTRLLSLGVLAIPWQPTDVTLVEESNLFSALTDFERELRTRIIATARAMHNTGSGATAAGASGELSDANMIRAQMHLNLLQSSHQRVVSVLAALSARIMSWHSVKSSVHDSHDERLRTVVVRTIIQRLEEERSKLALIERGPFQPEHSRASSPTSAKGTPLRPVLDPKQLSLSFSLTALKDYDSSVYSWLVLLHTLRRFPATRTHLAKLHVVSTKVLYSLVKVGTLRVRRLALRTLKDVLFECADLAGVSSMTPVLGPVSSALGFASSPDMTALSAVSAFGSIPVMLPELNLTPSMLPPSPPSEPTEDDLLQEDGSDGESSASTVRMSVLRQNPLSLTASPHTHAMGRRDLRPGGGRRGGTAWSAAASPLFTGSATPVLFPGSIPSTPVGPMSPSHTHGLISPSKLSALTASTVLSMSGAGSPVSASAISPSSASSHDALPTSAPSLRRQFSEDKIEFRSHEFVLRLLDLGASLLSATPDLSPTSMRAAVQMGASVKKKTVSVVATSPVAASSGAGPSVALFHSNWPPPSFQPPVGTGLGTVTSTNAPGTPAASSPSSSAAAAGVAVPSTPASANSNSSATVASLVDNAIYSVVVRLPAGMTVSHFLDEAHGHVFLSSTKLRRALKPVTKSG